MIFLSSFRVPVSSTRLPVYPLPNLAIDAEIGKGTNRVKLSEASFKYS